MPDFLPPSPYDYSLRDLFGDIRRGWDANEKRRGLRRQFEEAGVQRGHNINNPYGGHSDRLANLMTFNNQADPQIQARFLTMLKQLGYLPNQAY